MCEALKASDGVARARHQLGRATPGLHARGRGTFARGPVLRGGSEALEGHSCQPCELSARGTDLAVCQGVILVRLGMAVQTADHVGQAGHGRADS